MELNNIVLELMNRIQVLEKKVEFLESQISGDSVVERVFPNREIGNKYKPLAEYLFRNGEKKVELTYKEIEHILGFTLPSTAYNYPQSFWANTETHSYSSAWLKVDYRARTNIAENKVIFEKNIY